MDVQVKTMAAVQPLEERARGASARVVSLGSLGQA